jgi:hypothetical protein
MGTTNRASTSNTFSNSSGPRITVSPHSFRLEQRRQS